MIDDYTPYDDIYLPVNSMIEYDELKQLLIRWIQSLDEADKLGYNTCMPRIRIERIKRILDQMDHIAMPIIKTKVKPWEQLGISVGAYYHRRKKQFNNIVNPWDRLGISRSTYYNDLRRSKRNE